MSTVSNLSILASAGTGKTFRLSNMGDETTSSVGELLAALDDCLKA